MRETSRRRPEDVETGFDLRDWLTAILAMGGLMAGSLAVLAVVYWLMTGR